MQSEGTPPAEAFNPAVKRSGWQPPTDSGLWSTADAVEKLVNDWCCNFEHVLYCITIALKMTSTFVNALHRRQESPTDIQILNIHLSSSCFRL